MTWSSPRANDQVFIKYKKTFLHILFVFLPYLFQQNRKALNLQGLRLFHKVLKNRIQSFPRKHVENSKCCFVEISTFETIFSLCQQDLSTYF